MATPQEKLDKMKELLKLVNEGMTQKDFVDAFANVVKFVKDMQTRNEREIEAMKASLSLSSEQTAADAKNDMGEMKNMLASSLQDAENRIASKLAEADAKMDALKDGEDGQDGEDGVSPDLKQIAQEVMKTLDLSPLYDKLERELEDMRAKIKEIPERPTFSFIPGRSIPRIFVIDLSTQLDGSTKSFALPTNFGIIAVNSSSAPFGAFRPIVDYQQIGKNLVFDPLIDAPSALATGQSLTVTILK